MNRDEVQNPANTKKVNNTSEKYMSQKFEREFYLAVLSLISDDNHNKHQSPSRQIAQRKIYSLNYLKLKELLVQMHLMSDKSTG